MDVVRRVRAFPIPASGDPIEQGTVVIRDGLIAAVGADVAIPIDARVLDNEPPLS